ncbi:MAG: prepilin peptidase [Alkaliphilus sp.]
MNNYIVLLLLVIASVIDIKKRTIPNKLLLVGVALWLLSVSMGEVQLTYSKLIEAVIISLILFLLYVASNKKIGFGDIKLLILMCLYLRTSELVGIFIVASILCGFLSAVLLVSKKAEKNTSIPFAPFLLIASFLVLII